MKNSTRLHFILLSAAVLLSFAPSLWCRFLNWDDYAHYISNPCVYSLSWSNLVEMFKQTVNETYIPLTTLSFNLEYHLFGASSFVSHLINMLLHLSVAWMVYLFAKQLKFSAWEAFVAAGLFALHPMRVESVAWVTERKDVLGILFYMLCLWQYWKYLETSSRKNYGLSLLFAFLSVLTKAMALSIPWVLLLVDWYYRRRLTKYVWLDKIPFAVLIFPIVWITVSTVALHPNVGSHSWLIGLWSLMWYLDKFFLPFDLQPAYSAPFPVALVNIHYFKSLLILIAFGGSLWLWRKNRLFVFACLFWLSTIFIFWRFDFTLKNIVADRFMYLPCIILTLWIAKQLAPYKKVCIVLAVFLGVLTFQQCGVWKNDRTIWAAVVQRDPKCVLAKVNYDHMYYVSIDNNINFKGMTKQIDQDPLSPQAYLARGEALLKVQNPYLAIMDANKAIQLNPRDDKAFVLRGQMRAMLIKYELALEDFNQAIAINPRNDNAHLQKASVLLYLQRNDEALSSFAKALEINPGLIAVYNQRGYLYIGQEEYRKAIKDFTVLIEHGFELNNSYYERGKCYEHLMEYDQAIDDLTHSLAYDPYDVTILNDLAVVYLKKKDIAKGMELLNRCIILHPYMETAYHTRAITYMRQGKYDLAIKDLDRVVELMQIPYDALILRGDIHLMKGEATQALKDYRQAALLTQKDPQAKQKADQLAAVLSKV